jgi:hypothetical protein
MTPTRLRVKGDRMKQHTSLVEYIRIIHTIITEEFITFFSLSRTN